MDDELARRLQTWVDAAYYTEPYSRPHPDSDSPTSAPRRPALVIDQVSVEIVGDSASRLIERDALNLTRY